MSGPFLYHEKQKYGQCGRHAINNASGEEVESEESYCQKMRKFLLDEIPDLDEEVLKNMTSPGSLDTDPAMIQYVFEKRGIKTRSARISEIEGSLSAYVGNTDWIIIGNQGKGSITINNHSIMNGHFIALRKYEEEWWIVDSLKFDQTRIMLDDPELRKGNLVLIVPA